MNNVVYIPRELLTYSDFAGAVKSDIQRICQNGQFFTVVFTKQNGKTRRMTARLNVRKYLKGGSKSSPEYPDRLTVWDCASGEYRTISLDRLQRITMAGKTVYFN